MNNATKAAVIMAVAAGVILISTGSASASMNKKLDVSSGTGTLGTQNGEMAAFVNFASFDSLFRAAGARYGVDPLLLKAISCQESSLNPRAVNASNTSDPSYGLMQISCEPDGRGGCLPGEFNFSDWPPAGGPAALLDPSTSIHYAAELMAENLRSTNGNMWEAVAMYNSGSTVDPAYVSAVGRFYALMGG